MHTATFWFLGITMLALGGCSSDNTTGATTGGNYATKCAVACKPSSGPCQGQDTKACESDCAALTQGLSPPCAQCLIENSGWNGVQCPSGCTNCCPESFGPEPGGGASVGTGFNGQTVGGGGPVCACSAADEKCTGYTIAKTSNSTCDVKCVAN